MAWEEVSYESVAQKFLEQLPKGAFLSVKGEPDNTLTIGWGAIGYIWRKPVLLVMVRPSRHSSSLLEKAGEFSVSVPVGQHLQKELLDCGKLSGRDGDKFERVKLQKEPSLALLHTPIVADCNLQFDCRTLLRQPMDRDALDEIVREIAYSNGDEHVFYMAEILACYIKR